MDVEARAVVGEGDGGGGGVGLEEQRGEAWGGGEGDRPVLFWGLFV